MQMFLQQYIHKQQPNQELQKQHKQIAFLQQQQQQVDAKTLPR